MYFKRTEYLKAEKESVENIPKKKKKVCGDNTVNRSNIVTGQSTGKHQMGWVHRVALKQKLTVSYS
jgi:hypothetical protein